MERSRVMRVRALIGALALTGMSAVHAHAQQTHVLIITGLGGEPEYSTAFYSAGSAIYKAAKADWGVAPASLIFLAEDPARDPAISAKATREEVQKAFTALAQRAAPGDAVFIFLTGHGSGEGTDSRVNLPGADPTAADYRMWLGAFAKQNVVFVNAASASGDFKEVLAGPARVIITATRTAFERNESVFSKFFAAGFATKEADADKDGRISVLEAFEYAKKEVARFYEGDKKLLTEHAVLTDTLLARSVAFGGAPVSNNPAIAALVAERRALEDALAELRARKAQMDSTAYNGELERLLIAIAEKTQAIKAAGGRH